MLSSKSQVIHLLCFLVGKGNGMEVVRNTFSPYFFGTCIWAQIDFKEAPDPVFWVKPCEQIIIMERPTRQNCSPCPDKPIRNVTLDQQVVYRCRIRPTRRRNHVLRFQDRESFSPPRAQVEIGILPNTGGCYAQQVICRPLACHTTYGFRSLLHWYFLHPKLNWGHLATSGHVPLGTWSSNVRECRW